MKVLSRMGAILLGIVVVGFALIGVLTTLRGTPVSRVRAIGDARPPAVGDPLFEPTAELLTETPLEDGNRVQLLLNGDETYPALWRDLRGARHSITVQSYYTQPGRMADTLSAILRERARAGVRVLFLVDAFGSQDLPDEYFDALRSAGVRTAVFRPIRWYSLDKAQHRFHVRGVVIDGRIGYTGGFGIDDKWWGDGLREGEWRETNVRFTGPAVMQLQGTFASAWTEATGILLTGDLFFPPAAWASTGTRVAGLLHSDAGIGSTSAARFLALSIAGARRTLYISNSYFIPDDDFVDLLRRADRRGVDVRILTAGPKTDVPLTRWAGRARYAELLEAGVRIWEYQPAMMHAKTLVADGLWSTVGGMNFDNRSLALNDESNLLVLDAEFGAELQRVFVADLRHAREIRLDRFRERPWTDRVREWGASLLSRLL